MNTVIWVLQILLAVAFVASGVMKATRPRAELARRTPYVEDFSDNAIKAIGVLELVAGLALIVLAVAGVATVLVPLAALGLAAIMVGAIVVHVRRDELPDVVVPAVLLVIAAVVAWARFGPYAL